MTNIIRAIPRGLLLLLAITVSVSSLTAQEELIENTFTCRSIADRKPVAGAEVFLVEPPYAFHTGEFYDVKAEARRHGVVLKSDAEGRVTLKRKTGTRLLAVASAPGISCPLYSLRTWDKKTNHVLVMEPATAVTVRVVDMNGGPVEGMPILWNWSVGKRPQFMRSAALCTVTKKDGRATLALAAPDFVGKGVVFTLSHGGLFPKKKTFTVDPANPPKEELVFTLPAFGSVAVSVDETIDLSVEGSDRVLMQPLSSEFGYGEVPFVMIRLVNRQANQRFVALNADPIVVLNQDGRAPQAKFKGPKKQGEALSATIGANSRPPTATILITLKSEDGKVFAKYPVKGAVLLETGSRRESQRVERTTDAQGRLKLDLPYLEGTTLKLQLQILATRDKLKPLYLLDPIPLKEGKNDLGEAVIEKQPFLVSGRVVDSEGKPQAYVPVLVSKVKEGGGPVVSVMGSEDEKPESSYFGLGARTNSEGRFQIFGPSEGTFRLSARKDSMSGSAIANPGAKDVQVVLKRPGQLSGRLSIKGKARVSDVIVGLRRSGNEVEFSHIACDADGRFAASAQPGVYDLVVQKKIGRHDILTQQSRLELKSGEVTNVGELVVRYDVSIISLKLKVLGLDALPVNQRGQVTLFDSAGREVASRGLFGSSRPTNFEIIRLDVESLPVKAVLVCPGMKRIEQQITELEALLKCERGYPVEVALKAKEDTPKFCMMRVALIEKFGSQDIIHTSDFNVDHRNGKAKIFVSRLGNFDVRLLVGRYAGDGLTTIFEEGISPRTVNVNASGSSIEVDYDPKKLKSLLDHMNAIGK